MYESSMTDTIKVGFGIAIGFALFQLAIATALAAVVVTMEDRAEQ